MCRTEYGGIPVNIMMPPPTPVMGPTEKRTSYLRSHCHGYRCTADSKYTQPDGIGNIYGFRHDVLWHFDIAIRPPSPDFRSDEEYKAGQESNA